MAIDEKRTSERIGFNKPILFGLERPPAKWAYIIDISEKGLFIKTNIIYPEGTVLYLTIKDEKGVDHELVGEVMRFRKIPPAFYKEGLSGMGINLLTYEEEFLEVYRKKLEEEK
ncbi:MAG: PilZ domain-containing protein [Deltaproteobacteria bacterium]|nr:PilZ domain-containing protein [Deltaproteobacteria bacterium]